MGRGQEGEEGEEGGIHHLCMKSENCYSRTYSSGALRDMIFIEFV